MSKIKSFKDFKESFSYIKNKPYNFKINNDKDVGDFFEGLLGKSVDNESNPDLSEIDTELKTSSGKKKTTSFTKSPCGGLSIRELVYRCGYNNGEKILRLMSSVNTRPNNLGLYLKVKKDRLFLMKNNNELSYWDMDVLIKKLIGKMPNLAYVKYEKEKNRVIFKECILYRQINSTNFAKLIEKNLVIVELRAREGYPDESCSIRDRGTAFRLTDSNIYDYIFNKKEVI